MVFIMSTKKKYNIPKIFEFRIKYNAGADHSANDSFHYYNAETSEQALNYHYLMMRKHGFKSQTLSIEKKNPYSNRWEDESEIIPNEN